MRAEQFEQWLNMWRDAKDPTKSQYAESTPPTYRRDAERVEEAEKVDLDQEYEKDKMEAIIRLYTYAEGDTDKGVRDRINMVIKPKDPKKPFSESLSCYALALNRYREFRSAFEPIIVGWSNET